MAFYQKTLENVTNIPTADYRQREREFSDASNSGATGSLVSTHSCLTGTTGPINLPTLAPIHGNEISLVNVTDDIDIDPGVGGGGLYGQREQDRKVRREIANSNERRRMQSINAGFNSLKTILPHTDGDKLSKASILQQTAEYILQLESDKLKLLNQNEKLRRAYSDCICAASKHKTLLYESLDKDEGIGSPREEDLEDVRRDAIEVRQQLDKERRLRMLLEDQVRDLESKIYPEKLRELAHTVASQHRSSVAKKLDDTTPSGHTTPAEKNLHPRFAVSVANRKSVSVNETPVTTTAIITSPPRLQSPIRYQVQPKLPPLQTAVETEVPHPGVCVTVENTEEVPHMLAQSKYCGSIPRSRQPLKKRAVELTEPDQIAPCKVAKVCAQTPSAKTQSTNPPVKSVKVVSLKAPDISPVPKPEPQVVFPTPAQNRTYMTLTQPGKTQIWQEPKTATQNFQITVTNNTPQIAGSQYVIQPNIQMSQPKQEITLNQLNNVSSLSMTLTQLNALSTACTRASIIPVHQTTGSRVQAQYLPLVAMDTVLGRHSERRISSATTDSVASDEEKHEVLDETVATEENIPTVKLPAPVSRSKSDPGPVLPIDGHPGPSADGNTGSPASDGIACNSPAATVSVLSNGPGSPPMIRRIDAVATRRNLETIVQAIDHLEQQERRNSQDHQHSDESAT